MKYITFILLLLFLSACDRNIIETQEVYFEGRKYTEGSRTPLIDNNSNLENRTLTKELSLNVNTDVLSFFYWDNKVTGITDSYLHKGDERFRIVGWDFKLGMHLFEFLDLEYGHNSIHMLDAQFPYPFPVQDWFGFKLYLYRSDRPIEKTLIPFIK